MNDNYKIKKAAALQYNQDTNNAPKVIAKGKGEIAENIIKIAQENNLPIKKDPDLVELLSKIDIEEEIPENMYKAVAEIFSFLYELSNKNSNLQKKNTNTV